MLATVVETITAFRCLGLPSIYSPFDAYDNSFKDIQFFSMVQLWTFNQIVPTSTQRPWLFGGPKIFWICKTFKILFGRQKGFLDVQSLLSSSKKQNLNCRSNHLPMLMTTLSKMIAREPETLVSDSDIPVWEFNIVVCEWCFANFFKTFHECFEVPTPSLQVFPSLGTCMFEPVHMRSDVILQWPLWISVVLGQLTPLPHH